ncbi:MAG: hypothetical protein RL516_2229 [Bacteroidota bacterium]|jgi:hypothetical protein
MGFRFQKRVSLGSGLGLNISKSGVSPSYRTRYGSISSKGFSFRTGVAGLTYRSGFGGRKRKGNSGDALLLLFVAFWLVIISLLIILKLIELFFWLLTELIKFIQRVQYRRQIKKEIEQFKDSTIVTVLNFEADSLPEEMRSMKVKFQGALVENGSIVEKDQEVATFVVGDKIGRMLANKAGKIKFAKLPGDRMRIGDCVCMIETIIG